MLGQVEVEDLIKFGMIPEFLGRLPLIATLDPLSESDLVRILLEPKDALVTQYKSLMATENVELIVTEDAVAALADIAYELNQTTENIGARRLTTVMERLVEDISFEADQLNGQKVVIDKAYVDSHLQDIVKDPDLSRYIL